MRAYAGTTIEGLRALQEAGRLAAPLAATAVTPELREWYAAADAEELEYAALTAAARDSLRLLAAPGACRVLRRVVVAFDVPDAAAKPDPERGRAAVHVAQDVPLRDVAAIHVDDPAAVPVIAAAAAAWVSAEAGDEDAVAAVEDAEAEELLWFASQELPDILA